MLVEYEGHQANPSVSVSVSITQPRSFSLSPQSLAFSSVSGFQLFPATSFLPGFCSPPSFSLFAFNHSPNFHISVFCHILPFFKPLAFTLCHPPHSTRKSICFPIFFYFQSLRQVSYFSISPTFPRPASQRAKPW